MFNICRNTVDDSDDLIDQWINLFGHVEDDEIEDEMLFTAKKETSPQRQS